MSRPSPFSNPIDLRASLRDARPLQPARVHCLIKIQVMTSTDAKALGLPAHPQQPLQALLSAAIDANIPVRLLE